jgi:uncharacterized membrane protein
LHALADLAPKVLSWLISFFVLAIFWISHHRLLHYVRSVDAGLLWRNLFQLAFVSLMPFSAALIGGFGGEAISQIIYNGNMAALGLLGLIKLRYVRRHPELWSHPMEDGTYHATLVRIGGLLIASVGAMIIAQTAGTSFATLIYLVMIPLGSYSRRLERNTIAQSRPTVVSESHTNDHP